MPSNRYKKSRKWARLAAIGAAAFVAPALVFAAGEPNGGFDTQASNCVYETGWAYDPDGVPQVVTVHVYDGPMQNGKQLASLTANGPRPDLNAVGLMGDHGFILTLPDSVKDGLFHTLYAYAIDMPSGAEMPLPVNSPKTIRCTRPNQAPVGDLQVASCDAVIGWAYDPDMLGQPVQVHFYVDVHLAAEMSGFAGTVSANIASPDVNRVMNVTGDHVFSWTLPEEFKDGRPHQLYAYAIDSASGAKSPLNSTPKQFQCALPSSKIVSALPDNRDRHS